MRSTERNLIALLILAVLAACGGGGGAGSSGGSVLPGGGGSAAPGGGATATPGAGGATATPGALPAGFARAAFTITVPTAASASASVRRTKLIEPTTNSITFTLLQPASSSDPPQTFALTTSDPACTSGANGLTCILSVTAPISNPPTAYDIFLAQTYTGTNGTGTLTGSGAVRILVSQNATNTASLSLNGTVASVYLATSASYLGVQPVQGDSLVRLPAARRSAQATTNISSIQVIPIALDSNNDPILNPSTYDSPIVLQLLYVSGSYTDTTSAPDVTLNVAHSSSVDPQGCGGNSTTSALFGTVNVCSPSDTVTATIANVAGGATGASILAGFGANPVYFTNIPASPTPMPLPTATPAGFSYVSFPVAPAIFSVTDQNGIPLGATNPVEFLATNLTDYIYINDPGFTGTLTFGGNCGSIVTNQIYPYGGGYFYAPITSTAAGQCTASISDGTNAATFPIIVTTTTVTGS